MVSVMVDVSRGGRVISNVSGTGLGVSAVGVLGVGVLEGWGEPVIVGGRLGVDAGSAEACTMGVATTSVSTAAGKPDPIKISRITAKNTSAIPLKTIPWNEGRSRKT